MNLITSDNYIIITKRGENVALYPNLFNTAVSGTFDPEVDLNEDKKPCIFHSIARETKDEIGIKIKLEDIQVYSLILEYEYCKPEIIGEIRLKCSKKDLIEFERSPDERWEYDSLQFIKFEPQKIYEILKNENWIPQAAICIIDSLNREYGREGVKRALSGVL
jgi:isopentenyldiphosphate isomerase